MQWFVDVDHRQHYFTIHEERPDLHDTLRAVAVFDLLANNTDRKSGHVLIDGDDHIWGIDHGLCFAADFKLRTVVWEFGGEPIDRAPDRRDPADRASVCRWRSPRCSPTTRSRRCRSERSGSTANPVFPVDSPAAATRGRSCERRRPTTRPRRADPSRRPRRLGPPGRPRCAPQATGPMLLELRNRSRSRGRDRPAAVAGGDAGRVPAGAVGSRRMGGAGARRGQRPVHDRPADRGRRPAPQFGDLARRVARRAASRLHRPRVRAARTDDRRPIWPTRWRSRSSCSRGSRSTAWPSTPTTVSSRRATACRSAHAFEPSIVRPRWRGDRRPRGHAGRAPAGRAVDRLVERSRRDRRRRRRRRDRGRRARRCRRHAWRRSQPR